jgi:hypothetical protein
MEVDPEAHKRGRYLAYWLAYRNVSAMFEIWKKLRLLTI